MAVSTTKQEGAERDADLQVLERSSHPYESLTAQRDTGGGQRTSAKEGRDGKDAGQNLWKGRKLKDTPPLEDEEKDRK